MVRHVNSICVNRLSNRICVNKLSNRICLNRFSDRTCLNRVFKKKCANSSGFSNRIGLFACNVQKTVCTVSLITPDGY